ncbi:MAG: hypothetical protein M1816_005305 [Peltula sp. TS41687]|nr:MAG: hypothetical protein M1816_005305 [Peltula sp. TS41687]
MDYRWDQPRMYGRIEDPFIVQAARPGRWRRRMVSNEFGRVPAFFPAEQSDYLAIDDGCFDQRRSRSQNGRLHAPHPPNAVPVVINNNIRNEELLQMRGRPVSMHEVDMDPPLPLPGRHREHSRPLPEIGSSSRDQSPFQTWQKEQEREQLKKELDVLKRDKERKEHEQRIKNELILQRAKEEQEAREAADRKKKIQEDAIKEWENKEKLRIAEEERKKREEKELHEKLEKEAVLKWQREQKEKADKEREEKEQKEADYKERLKRDLGLNDAQIAKLANKENSAALDLRRTTYTKIARRHISLETLKVYDLPYKLDDHDPEGYVLVKRWVPEYLQERLWEHTRRIREERQFHQRKLMLEEDMARLEIVRKKKVVRARSPGLLDLFAPRR